MNHVKTLAQRPFYFALAAATLVAISAPALLMSRVSAAATGAQVTARSIALSSSKASDTLVSYNVTFTPVNAAQELIIDFCGDTPIIGANCTFSAANAPTLTTATTAKAGAALTHTAHTVKITGLTMTAGSPYNIQIDNVINPTSVTSFYARIYTFTTGNSAGFTPAAASGGATTTGTYVDYGGIALSTAATVDITARVMESLSFCVYTTACGDQAALELGTGSPTKVLDTINPYTGTLKYSLSTNAKNGADINLKGDTLKSGSNSIAAVGGGTAKGTIAGGTEGFGVKFGAVTATNGTMTPTLNYNGSGGTYALIIANTTSTYGDQVVDSSAPVNQAVGDFTYAAAASVTTPAGIYTASHQLIATGTF